MPAIHLPRLRLQIAELLERFEYPESFSHGISDLFELYADHVHRPGQAGKPPPLIRSYNVPQPMLRLLLNEIQPFAKRETQQTLALADRLWEEPFLESRLVAIFLLGKAPMTLMGEVLSRAESWALDSSEEQLINALAEDGLERLRMDGMDELLAQVEQWLISKNTALQRLGLRILLSLVENINFENMPVILGLLTPFSRSAPLPVRPDVIDLFSALARRSPQETAYYLRQNLEAPHNPDTGLIIRQSLPNFPVDIAESLRSALRQRKS